MLPERELTEKCDPEICIETAACKHTDEANLYVTRMTFGKFRLCFADAGTTRGIYDDVW